MRLEAHKFDSVEAALTWGRSEIDKAAGQARQKYITIVEGQEATYIAKYEDAKKFLVEPDRTDIEEYPWVFQEAMRTGRTAKECADWIKTEGDIWNFRIGPQIESARLAGKEALLSMVAYGQIVSHVRAVQRQLAQI